MKRQTHGKVKTLPPPRSRHQSTQLLPCARWRVLVCRPPSMGSGG